MKRLLITFALLVAFVGVSTAQDAPMPVLDDLPVGEWSQISPGGDTVCSNGTPYSFFVYPNESSSEVMVHFQGGGACWFGQICDLTADPTYDPFVDESDLAGLQSGPGIFDMDNEENPFMDYSVVVAPYCSADVHLGDIEATYPVGEGDDATEVTIQHRGYVNATTTLDWMYENYEAPETVVVTGCSAGAIPAPFYTELIADNYPDARIELFSEGAGGYRNPTAAAATLGSWGTLDILTDSYADFTLDTITYEDFYITPANLYPNITFSQFNAANDEVQRGFLFLTGLPVEDLQPLLQANLDDIENETENDNFRYFLAGGDGHCVAVTPDFYTYAVGDVTLRDWLADVVAGEDVETVSCEDCSEADLVDMEDEE